MLVLHDDPDHGRFGQWLFHCNGFLAILPAASRLNIVISNAGKLLDYAPGQIVAGVLAQIAAQSGGRPPMPPVESYELIPEKRATSAAVPGLHRPANVSSEERRVGKECVSTCRYR